MSSRFRWAFLAIVALQVLILVGMAAYKETTLRTGEVVVLQTVPVDPRDLFRGDYVVLGYEISTLGDDPSRLPRGAQRVCCVYGVVPGDAVFVRLAPDPSGQKWIATSLTREEPQGDVLFIKGTVVETGPAEGSMNWVRVEYGIESYFVPEGQGRAIEQARDVKVRVAVNGFGSAVIKELIVDGETWRPQ
ncbi:MAG: GDYXXLXY domain-containing protein [Chloroflexi bacterium]|nr:GDYXXLXY domain-containing protein [Chloroflexota bacterium]